MECIEGKSKRINVLANLWDEFAREHHVEIKEMILTCSPWHTVNYWCALYADWILEKQGEVEFLTDSTPPDFYTRRLDECRRRAAQNQQGSKQP
jgi:hypothetical protein